MNYSMSKLLTLYRLIFRIFPLKIRKRIHKVSPPFINNFHITLPNNEKIYFQNTDSFNAITDTTIHQKLFWEDFPGYEKETIKLFFILAQKATTIIDIGSYFGYFAMVAAKANPQAVIHSIEPVPAAVSLQNEYLKHNNIRNISIHQVALSNKPGTN